MPYYRPLSRRDDPSYDEPVEGLPDYLVAPVLTWVQQAISVEFAGQTMPSKAKLLRIQTTLRLSPPLDWTRGVSSAWRSLQDRILRRPSVALDCLDLLVRDSQNARALETVLREGGSAWQVASGVGGAEPRLERRSPAAVSEVIDALYSDSERAHRHLRDAWSALVGRDPNPSTAYREAVRAVEVAAKPVVSPDNARATLGTIIRDLKAKPQKWTVHLDHATVDQVIALCEFLWHGQIDRHGDDDPATPLNVTQAQADAAFYAALTLTRWFTAGAIESVAA